MNSCKTWLVNCKSKICIFFKILFYRDVDDLLMKNQKNNIYYCIDMNILSIVVHVNSRDNREYYNFKFAADNISRDRLKNYHERRLFNSEKYQIVSKIKACFRDSSSSIEFKMWCVHQYEWINSMFENRKVLWKWIRKSLFFMRSRCCYRSKFCSSYACLSAND